MRSGVYRILNTVNGREYIGSSSVDCMVRFRAHKYLLGARKHQSPLLQEDWIKFGPECFVWEMLECCDGDSCVSSEQLWIDRRNPQYNVMMVAESGGRGWRHSAATKDKISKAKMGNTCGRFAEHRSGWHHTEEARRKMSIAKIGNRFMVGRSLSSATKAKIGASITGIKESKETLHKKRIAMIRYIAMINKKIDSSILD